MKNNQHNPNLRPEPDKDFLSKTELSYSKSKAEVWEALEKKMEEKPRVQAKPAKVIFLKRRRLVVAASLALLLSLGFLARFYTTNIRVVAGQKVKHTLPDGSVVHLNAASKLTYHPYWWYFTRSVALEGEGFFEIKTGKQFKVRSPLGSTEVLGTKFNIYTRENHYQVFCESGQVKVKDNQENFLIIGPGELVALDTKGSLQNQKDFSQEEVLSWRLNKFIYNATPLDKVLQDFERHYDVKITTKVKNIHRNYYTGLFNRTVSIEEALAIVCYSFDLKFESRKDQSFVIRKK